MAEGDKKINVYNPSTETVSLEPINDIYRFIPAASCTSGSFPSTTATTKR